MQWFSGDRRVIWGYIGRFRVQGLGSYVLQFWVCYGFCTRAYNHILPKKGTR